MNNQPIIIDVEGLTKSFHGKQAVSHFTFQMKQGEICGFLGPNGSGKTTTLRMLCGLLTPDSGQGHVLGYDVRTQSYEIKKQVGYMTQSFSLYSDLTAYENLNLIARLFEIPQRQAKIQEYLEHFELMDRKNQLAGEMSGGWRQRLALASCLLHEPKVLLLDEPTAGVDPKARREFWDNLFLLSQQGITTLVSTHYMDEAERCTQLVYIAYGHLLATGTIAEIMQQTQLTTWLVQAESLSALSSLASSLKNLPGIEQVSFFGNSLHISSKNAALLNESITPYKTSSWREIPAGLEDAFISLVASAEQGS